jgi:hypothetical protein
MKTNLTYDMKFGTRPLILFFLVILLATTSCTKKTLVIIGPKHAPPGQVKKATGSTSAKAYAPGQVKKQQGSSNGNGKSSAAPGQKKKK